MAILMTKITITWKFRKNNYRKTLSKFASIDQFLELSLNLRTFAALQSLRLFYKLLLNNTLTSLMTTRNSRQSKYHFNNLNRCYQLWIDYKKDLDSRIENFIIQEDPNGRLSLEQIQHSLQRMQQVDPDVLSCIDYLMASSDYLEFVGLMLDFKVGVPTLDQSVGSQLMGTRLMNDATFFLVLIELSFLI